MSVYKKSGRQTLFNVAFIAPALVLFSVFVILPFIQGIPYAFTDWDGFSKSYHYVGWTNFVNLFTDNNVRIPAKNTLLFTAITVICCNVIGLLLAMGIQRSTKLNTALRTIFFMPFVISVVLSSYIWSSIYSDVFYHYFGIKSLLGNSDMVVPALALISVWRDAGYCMIIYIAALQMVPAEFYEAARVEGSGPIHRFFKITIPLIVPAFTANTTLILAWGLKVFEYPMIATGGGPGRSSESLTMYIYNNIFVFYKAGYGQAASILFTLFLFIVSVTVTGFLRKKEVEI